MIYSTKRPIILVYPSTSTFHDATQGSTNGEYIERIVSYHKAMYSCLHIQYHTCITCKNGLFLPCAPLETITFNIDVYGD